MKQEKLFRECRLAWLEKTFGLVQVDALPSLNEWLSASENISNHHKETLLELQQLLTFNVRSWNEQELDRSLNAHILSSPTPGAESAPSGRTIRTRTLRIFRTHRTNSGASATLDCVVDSRIPGITSGGEQPSATTASRGARSPRT